ncbi:MAG: FliI/YscN family ATPase [Polyangiales bacterium]
MTIDLERLSQTLTAENTVRIQGRVRGVVGLALHIELPDARVGELIEITRQKRPPLQAEIVGFDARGVTALPLGAADGIGPDDIVTARGAPLSIRVGRELLGRVLNGLGEPIDGGPTLEGESLPVVRHAPPALTRRRIDRVLPLGVRALDAFSTIGEGQRVGLFSAAGVGKSTLLGQVARSTAADVVVLCLIGERGRELGDFLSDHLPESTRARSVVVCATSDAPAMVRMKCPFVATTIAEYFRDRGQRVLLLVDSVTRFARAGREVGLAAGEAPARRGYPPSAFAALPGLLERAGAAESGSITAIYSVLVEGDDLDEPVSDELRGLLDGHVVLSRKLAARGQHPAVDVGQSLSRLMPRLVSPQHLAAAELARTHLALYEEKRDLILLGAYRAGSDPRTDAAIARVPEIEAFLSQRVGERADYDETSATLQMLV